MKVYNYFKNKVEKSLSQEFRSRYIDERRNYLIEEMNRNEMMTKKYRNISTTPNYIEHFLILASKIPGCVSITAFSSLVGILIRITSSAMGLNICAIATGIKKYKSMIKRKKKKHDKIILLAKSKLKA